MSKEYQQLQVVLDDIFGEKPINNSSNERAISLIDKNIVFETKKSNFQSEFIITRSEIQAVLHDQNRKLQSSILSNSSLILIFWPKPVENN